MDQARGQAMPYQPALQWPAEGNARVPYRVFSDPEIYREELARIFLGPTWQFLTLAGELPRRRSSKSSASLLPNMSGINALPLIRKIAPRRGS